jgi:sugar phosphate isomerase/epimerase
LKLSEIFQNNRPEPLGRRQFLHRTGVATMAAVASQRWMHNAMAAENQPGFEFNYMLASCLYGYQYVREILPAVRATGATAIDIWPKVHGNQRQQISDLGIEKFAQMMEDHQIRLGCITRYDLGPFGLRDEMTVAAKFDCKTIVTGGAGPKSLTGIELRGAVAEFVKMMKPHLQVAAEQGVTIAIENHGNNLIDSPDSLRWLAEFAEGLPLGIALAPYHLPQEPEELAKLIRDLGPSIQVFYAWQHGDGCMEKMSKEKELLQLPGRGELDFRPLVDALREIRFDGWTEIFMHPFPRGIPILETNAEIEAEVNRARQYLDHLVDG